MISEMILSIGAGFAMVIGYRYGLVRLASLVESLAGKDKRNGS